MIRDKLKALLATLRRLEADYAYAVATAGRLAMLGGAVAAAMPALGQVYRLEPLAALQTLGHAAAIAGAAVMMRGRRL